MNMKILLLATLLLPMMACTTIRQHVQWKYIEVKDGIEITGIEFASGAMPATLSIPQKINGKRVVSIGAYAFNRTYYGKVVNDILDDVVTLRLNKGLKRIGRGAFEGCLFKTVVIPPTLKTVESFAFYQSPNLKSVKIPEGVVVLKECCFGKCPALSKITLPASIRNIERAVFEECSSLTDVIFKGPRPSLASSVEYCETRDDIFYHVPVGLIVYAKDADGWKGDDKRMLVRWSGRPVRRLK